MSPKRWSQFLCIHHRSGSKFRIRSWSVRTTLSGTHLGQRWMCALRLSFGQAYSLIYTINYFDCSL